jgi:hypothetical protein
MEHILPVTNFTRSKDRANRFPGLRAIHDERWGQGDRVHAHTKSPKPPPRRAPGPCVYNPPARARALAPPIHRPWRRSPSPSSCSPSSALSPPPSGPRTSCTSASTRTARGWARTAPRSSPRSRAPPPTRTTTSSPASSESAYAVAG